MITASGDWPLIVTALFAGLLGSGHCFAMCGGIAGSLGALGAPEQGESRWLPGVLFNLGRLLSYIALGALGAVLIGGAGDWMNVPHWARVMRVFTALIILLIGLRFLFNLRLLDRLERAGGRLWGLVQPLAVRWSAQPGPGSRVLVGACWGLLPCGLVYSALLLALSSGHAVRAAAVMAAFGAGTLPSMLGMTWMSPALRELLDDPVVRRLIGLSLVLLSLWTVFVLVDPGSHPP